MSHPFRDAHLGTATAKLIHRADGTQLLSVEEPLGDYPDTLLDAPPRLDAHEITDKGSINQRAVLENRAGVVAGLYRDAPPPAMLRLD